MSAFNSAWDQYDEPEERRGDDSREETAHKVVWPPSRKSTRNKVINGLPKNSTRLKGL
jgi:cation transport regulator ChaB